MSERTITSVQLRGYRDTLEAAERVRLHAGELYALCV